jgi:hypothetical protein
MMEIRFKLEKETKGALRYQEVERVRGAHPVESVAPLPDHALPRELDSRSRSSLLPLYQRLAGRPSAPPRVHFRWGVIRSLSFIATPPFVRLQDAQKLG